MNSICAKCRRKLKSMKSKEVGYGPTCYKRLFGISISTKDAKTSNATVIDDMKYYEIPGQMKLSEFIYIPEGGR